MNLVAVMPVRNEAWVLGASLRVALRWCDSVVVLAHCCTDTSVDIIMDVESEHPNRVLLVDEPDPHWQEMNHRQRLLECARNVKATHVAIVDADEIITANRVSTIRKEIEELKPGVCLNVGLPCVWRDLEHYRVDPGLWSERYDLSLAFADSPGLSWSQDGYDHHHRHPKGSTPVKQQVNGGGVMHLQWANWGRLVAKQVWYQMMEMLKYPEKPLGRFHFIHYGKAMDETWLQLAEIPGEWWGTYSWLKHFVDLKSPGWHLQECRRLVRECGVERFNGVVGLESVL